MRPLSAPYCEKNALKSSLDVSRPMLPTKSFSPCSGLPGPLMTDLATARLHSICGGGAGKDRSGRTQRGAERTPEALGAGKRRIGGREGRFRGCGRGDGRRQEGEERRAAPCCPGFRAAQRQGTSRSHPDPGQQAGAFCEARNALQASRDLLAMPSEAQTGPGVARTGNAEKTHLERDKAETSALHDDGVRDFSPDYFAGERRARYSNQTILAVLE